MNEQTTSNGERTARILVVEDESHLAAGLKLNFELEGFKVDVAARARDASALLVENRYDAIVLDVMLPDRDGFSVCEGLRQAGDFTPVIMLTARNQSKDRVMGLDVGADDYLTKPFELQELLARVRSLLRRRRWDAPAGEGDAIITFGTTRIDSARHEATVNGEPIRLTTLELDLVRYFWLNPGRVIPREELLEEVWKLGSYPNTRTVDNFIVRLRRAFEPDPSKPIYFRSVRGAGYQFLPQGE